jgi:hypothetical protein
MTGMTQACTVVVTRVVDRVRSDVPADPSAGFGTGMPARPAPLG